MPKDKNTQVPPDDNVRPDIDVDTDAYADAGATLPTAGPGDAGYDWTVHYPGVDDLYIHTFHDGTTVALKPFASIYSKTWLYKIRSMQTDVDMEFASIDRAACETAKAVLESLDDTVGDPLDELFTAWVKAGTSRGDGDEGLTPGE